MPSKMFPLVEYNLSSPALKLFQAVIAADVNTSKALITRHPECMLEILEMQHREGSTSWLSVLQYVCFTYNSVMCNFFFNAIKNDPVLKAKFIAQVKEQETHIDLNPLFAAYETFLQAYSNFASRTEIITKHPHQAWHEIGAMQKKILQTYMLGEFIFIRNSSETKPQIYDPNTESYLTLSLNVLHQKKAALLYDAGQSHNTLLLNYDMPILHKIDWVKKDLAAWRQLYEKKLTAYEAFLGELEQTPVSHKEEKRFTCCTIS